MELKVDTTDNDKIISMINASADQIRLSADRLSIGGSTVQQIAESAVGRNIALSSNRQIKFDELTSFEKTRYPISKYGLERILGNIVIVSFDLLVKTKPALGAVTEVHHAAFHVSIAESDKTAISQVHTITAPTLGEFQRTALILSCEKTGSPQYLQFSANTNSLAGYGEMVFSIKNVMVEFGTDAQKANSWSLALEDTANYAEIATGRNIVLGSNEIIEFDVSTLFEKDRYSISEYGLDKILGNSVIVSFDVTAKSKTELDPDAEIPEVAFNVSVAESDETAISEVYTATILANGESQRISFVLTCEQTGEPKYLQFSADTMTLPGYGDTLFSVKNVMVEFGNDATMANSWSLAPEDIASYTDNAISSQTAEETLFRLTNGFVNEGLYLEPDENGVAHLYLNASYIKAGQISANIVKTGLISSNDGITYFDLDNGIFATTAGTFQAKISEGGMQFFDSGSLICTIDADCTNVSSGASGVVFDLTKDVRHFSVVREFLDGSGGVVRCVPIDLHWLNDEADYGTLNIYSTVSCRYVSSETLKGGTIHSSSVYSHVGEGSVFEDIEIIHCTTPTIRDPNNYAITVGSSVADFTVQGKTINIKTFGDYERDIFSFTYDDAERLDRATMVFGSPDDTTIKFYGGIHINGTYITFKTVTIDGVSYKILAAGY